MRPFQGQTSQSFRFKKAAIVQSKLLQTYGEARLPRYTSYPTAPLFSPEIDADTYAGWLAELAADDLASLYFHVPFCRSMCWYCGCHTTIVARDEPIAAYMKALNAEIDTVAATIPHRQPVGHIHFGGGTPTIMAPEQFTSLMARLRRDFDFRPGAELAIEIDPRRLEQPVLDALAEGGINRASLGVQTFDPRIQLAINRVQTVECTQAAVDGLRKVGIDQVNFDLIYGLPHQTVESCQDTVAKTIAMRPDRLAVFGYAHVPDFKKHQRLIDTDVLPDGAARADQATAIADALMAAGYVQIGLDHFALPEDELAIAQAEGRLRRNFQGYTVDECDTLIGFGASAIGRSRHGHVQNDVAINRYSTRVLDGGLATARGYRMTADDRLRADVIERLMCDFAVDIPAICASHGADPASLIEGNPRLDRAIAEGMVEIEDGRLRMKGGYRFLVRVVAAAFDAHLEKAPRRFGKTA